MNTELRNLVAYGKHGLKAIAGGRGREARAAAAAIVFRSVEALRDSWSAPQVLCDFCGWRGRAFRTFATGGALRHNAVCPRCLSLERHRDFLRLFGAIRRAMPSQIRLLDVAPTAAFSEYCRQAEDIDYVSIDKASPLAMLRMDLQDLAFGSGEFDAIVCYHVLDYVADDVRAMKELHRILKPGGVGILQEGVNEAQVTEEWHRPVAERQFRIRQYGRDFDQRLSAAGFEVKTIRRDTGLVFLVAKTREALDALEALSPGPQQDPKLL